jgi:hypothetical protein
MRRACRCGDVARSEPSGATATPSGARSSLPRVRGSANQCAGVRVGGTAAAVVAGASSEYGTGSPAPLKIRTSPRSSRRLPA